MRLLDKYVLFDAPGQVELVTHHPAFRRILQHLESLDFRVFLPSLLTQTIYSYVQYI